MAPTTAMDPHSSDNLPFCLLMVHNIEVDDPIATHVTAFLVTVSVAIARALIEIAYNKGVEIPL